MDRRAKLQLRLQQTVEGLSVAAIVYYVAGLVGYVRQGAEGRRAAASNPTWWSALAIPVLAALVRAVAVRRAAPRDERGAERRAATSSSRSH